MSLRSTWAAIALGLAALWLAPASSMAFPESTETRGELPQKIDGIWMVVNQIVYSSATPEPTPQPGETPRPTGTPVADAPKAKERILNAVQLLRIEHVSKAVADESREEDQKRAAASLAKAQAILEKEKKTDTKIVIPVVPTRPDAPPPPSGDQLEIYLMDVNLPASVEQSFKAANDKAVDWVPTEQDLKTMKADWKSLKPSNRDEFSRINWKVTTAAEFDDQLKTDPTLTDAKFAIVSNQEMIPKPTQPKSNILVYGVQNQTADRMSGKHVRAMMAAAPFPIPIELKGRYTMYRIDDLPDAPAKKDTDANAPAKKP
jgi:hypothetical protein